MKKIKKVGKNLSSLPKNMLITGGVLTSVFMVGVSGVNAQTLAPAATSAIHSEQKSYHRKSSISSRKNSVELTAAEASALQISVDQLKLDLQNHQSIKDIVKAQGITNEQYKHNLALELKSMVDTGQVQGSEAEYFKKLQTHLLR